MKRILLPLVFILLAAVAQASISTGGIAIVGFQDNGAPDSFSIVSLENFAVGEVIYFTDNGWTGSAFRSPSGTDGDGNETLTKFTAVNPIAAGAIISSTGTGPDFTWTISGLVPGAATGSFNSLSLGATGEQIYAFQAPVNLPLQNPTSHLYLLDTTGAFEPATDSATGDIAPGLSTAAFTAVTGFTPGGIRGLNPADPDVFNLQVNGGTPAQWLSVIGDPANWTTGGQPTGFINIITAPEPSCAALLLGGGAAGLLRRRRAR